METHVHAIFKAGRSRNSFISFVVFLLSSTATSQVQVSREPRHVPVIQNEYIRLLDVRLPPGDTTFYHIHSTPSLFIILSDTRTASQPQGGEWTQDESVSGKVWYNPFKPDSMIHRVANIDTVVFHVNDIEILSSYHPAEHEPLPYPMILNNERACAYSLNKTAIKKRMKNHGPLIAELVSGDAVTLHAKGQKQDQQLKAGQHLYIAPETPYHFSSQGKGEIQMVLFEIK